VVLHEGLRHFLGQQTLQLAQDQALLGDGEKRTMAERYAKGETMEQLAVEYEVGIGTIWRCLQSGTKALASSVSPNLAPQR
jgi:hypothetical protein